VHALRGSRELLGVVGHHERSPVPFSFDPIGMTPLAAPSFPSVWAHEYQEMCHRNLTPAFAGMSLCASHLHL
jgi:hypothetical protein